ncbi:DUF4276 family protein [Actinomyces viscosus]|uniref:DUF4276 domain-containing protein n=1 Tax=Actinomyces viscosus TaxID=1656 RepID=A0A3S4VFC3_ACTVI|nr:DUF4276 family protein [Actinomyces viscosus]TFH52200.1 DUF4276 family protein [Actinomyces viscosus]VEI17740.1 Uncharacterised protein [Actinomyces viscosus]
MKQVAVLVEGQTEEVVVKNVLRDAASSRGICLTPVVVTTSSTPTGAHRGGGHWKHYDAKLLALPKASHWYRVGLLLDYYQYPRGAPGRNTGPANHTGDSGPGRQSALISALRGEYPDPRFRPLVVLHEIEALVLAAIDAGQGDGLLPERGLVELRQAITRAGGPEQVNSGPGTAPSKRLEAADPRYMKTVTGPLLIAEAGLGAVLARCPSFRAWWEDLLT